ncbi:MAG: DUF1508 domain-containing protein [Clostridiales bacterium]|jgi:uncharacterized protein YegP (UPF0339 family)|nr:DUF1508 domain-containing protein [Clostridiales bacterium]
MSEKNTGGKYIVFPSQTRPGQVRFELKATNGQILYESKDFASEKSCMGGIETFKKAVAIGDFVIEEDKSGRFMFNLQNGGVTYIGQSVQDKKTVFGTIDAVKRYAVTDVIVNEVAQAKSDAAKLAEAAKIEAAKAAEAEKSAKTKKS